MSQFFRSPLARRSLVSLRNYDVVPCPQAAVATASLLLLLLLRSPSPCSPLRFSSSSSGSGHPQSRRIPRKVNVKEKDLESDESLWKLYQRWMRHMKVSRDPAEQQERFKIFKMKAIEVHKHNQMKDTYSYTIALNKFADITSDELPTGYRPSGRPRVDVIPCRWQFTKAKRQD